MITLNIPGYGELRLKNIVLDFNGTMAKDGMLLPGVEERLNLLAEHLNVYVLTADTFGRAQEACRNINCTIQVLHGEIGGTEKEAFVRELGADETVAVGNGNNDALMLKCSALGILVIGPEGATVRSLQAADVVVQSITEGLDLLLNTKRLIATLRA